jgi:hypothetical protein
MRPDARPQAPRNRRHIHWNTLGFVGAENDADGYRSFAAVERSMSDGLLRKGKPMTRNGNLVKGFVAALMMVGVVACSENSSPLQAPQDLVAKNDHAGLETWYLKEAAHLRERTKDMTAMAEEYQKIHGASTPGAVSAKIVLVQHCQTLAASYAKAADEADVMARAHQEMTGR